MSREIHSSERVRTFILLTRKALEEAPTGEPGIFSCSKLGLGYPNFEKKELQKKVGLPFLLSVLAKREEASQDRWIQAFAARMIKAVTQPNI